MWKKGNGDTNVKVFNASVIKIVFVGMRIESQAGRYGASKRLLK
jgi:hypothetical protein